MSQTAVRGSSEGRGHRSNTQGTGFICGSLEMLCLPPCSWLSVYRSFNMRVLPVVALEQHLNQNHSFIQSINESPRPVWNVCMLVAELYFSCMLQPQNSLLNTFPVFDVKGRLWPVTSPVLSPDQRVASFCTMTDMQRAEALQISRELTRRVVEAEGAALEAE